MLQGGCDRSRKATVRIQGQDDGSLGQGDRNGKSLDMFLNIEPTGYVVSWLWDVRGGETKDDPQTSGQLLCREIIQFEA